MFWSFRAMLHGFQESELQIRNCVTALPGQHLYTRQSSYWNRPFRQSNLSLLPLKTLLIQSCAYFLCPIKFTFQTLILASTTIILSSKASKGFKSSSFIDGFSVTSCDRRSIISTTPSRNTPFSPRYPFNNFAILIEDSISFASIHVTGANSNDTSFSIST